MGRLKKRGDGKFADLFSKLSIKRREPLFDAALQAAARRLFWKRFWLSPAAASRHTAKARRGTTLAHESNLDRPGYLRLAEVLVVFPVSRAAWYEGVKRGIYPTPVRLGARSVGYRVEDIRALIAAPANYRGVRDRD